MRYYTRYTWRVPVPAAYSVCVHHAVISVSSAPDPRPVMAAFGFGATTDVKEFVNPNERLFNLTQFWRGPNVSNETSVFKFLSAEEVYDILGANFKAYGADINPVVSTLGQMKKDLATTACWNLPTSPEGDVYTAVITLAGSVEDLALNHENT